MSEAGTPQSQDVAPSLEQVVEFAIGVLERDGILMRPLPPWCWDGFAQAQRCIEGSFEVPWTTITPMMRRFLFAVAACARPARLVGAGTYVGFAFSWLALGAASNPRQQVTEAIGVDIDPKATEIAMRNAARAGLASALRFETADAVAWLRKDARPIDLLLIDIDAPDHRKSSYIDVLAAARPYLLPGALILAHDACVPLFSTGFADFHAAIMRGDEFLGPRVLPLDECGISVCRFAP